MIQQLGQWLNLERYTNKLDRLQARGLLAIGLFLLIFTVPLYIGLSISQFAYVITPPVLILPLVALIIIVLARNGYALLSAYALIGLLLFVGGFALNSSLSLTGSFVAPFFLPIMLAGLLLRWRGILIVYAISCIIIIQTALAINSDPSLAYDAIWLDTIIILSAFSVIAATGIIFGSNLQSLANTYDEDIDNLRRLSTLASRISGERDDTSLMIQAINIIRDQFPQTFAQIFVLDSDNNIIERIYTGLGIEQVQSSEGTREKAPPAVISVHQSKEIRQISAQDASNLRQHFLPGVQAGLLLPLLQPDGEIISVLDIQTENIGIFNETTQESLLLLSQQLANAIFQARTLRNLRRELSEQNEQLKHQRGRLLALEGAERTLITQAWTDYLQEQQGILGFDIDGLNGELQTATDLPPALQQTLETGDIHQTVEDNQRIITLPIILQNQLLGAMSFALPLSKNLSPRQIELLRSVVQRLALALENKRLLERSQTQAQRESQANAIGNLLLSTTDVETVLQLAATNFNDALGAVRTQIYIQPEIMQEMPEENPS